jgi:hypothetical protein
VFIDFKIGKCKTQHSDTASPFLHFILKMQLLSVNELTSFGPYGRPKLVIDSSGNAIVTRDCRKILQYSKNSNLLDKFLLDRCIEYGVRYGDGTMTSAIILSRVLENITKSNISQNRISLLTAFQFIRHEVFTNRHVIQHDMVQCGLWRQQTIDSPLIQSICKNILIPATNDATANTIAHIIVCTMLFVCI